MNVNNETENKAPSPGQKVITKYYNYITSWILYLKIVWLFSFLCYKHRLFSEIFIYDSEHLWSYLDLNTTVVYLGLNGLPAEH